jgi:hypothetical protein
MGSAVTGRRSLHHSRHRTSDSDQEMCAMRLRMVRYDACPMVARPDCCSFAARLSQFRCESSCSLPPTSSRIRQRRELPGFIARVPGFAIRHMHARLASRRIHRFDQARCNAGHAFPFRKRFAHRVAPCCLRTLQRQLGMCALTQVNPTWRPADPIRLCESAGSIGGLPAFSTQVHRRRLRSPPGLPGRRQNAEPEASRLDRGPDPACRIPAAVLTRIKRTTGT